MTVRFRQDIQGLRAIAVAAVVIGHAFPNFLTGGYIGVDIFFVISGFLISGIIAKEIENGQFSIAGFYRRRAARILPALFVVLGTTLVVGGFLLSPQNYVKLAQSGVSASLFYANVFFSKVGYFDGAAETKPFLHMWSLAVEEQYYIIFPMVFVAARRWLGMRRALLVILVGALASLGYAEVSGRIPTSTTYYMLSTRAFELLIGALFSLQSFPALSAMAGNLVSVLGLAMMTSAIVLFTPDTHVPGIASLLPCLGAALFIHSGRHGHATWGGKLLSNSAFGYIGAISYSLYLWHWPVLAFLRVTSETVLPWAWAFTAIIVSVILASLSYYGVEKPCLRASADRRPVFKVTILAMIAVVLLCTFIRKDSGLPWRFSPQALALFTVSDDYNHRRNVCHYDGGKKLIPYGQSCVFGAAGIAPDVAVWGDSHGAELVVYLGEEARLHQRAVRQLTSSACPPALDFVLPARPRCAAANQLTLQALIADRAIHTVILTVNSNRYDDKTRLESGLGLSVAALTAAGKNVVLVKQIPIMPYDVAQHAGLRAQYGWSWDKLGAPRGEASAFGQGWDASLTNLAEKDARVSVYDPKDTLCDRDWCRAYSPESGILYFDVDHLGVAGVKFAFEKMAQKIYGST